MISKEISQFVTYSELAGKLQSFRGETCRQQTDVNANDSVCADEGAEPDSSLPAAARLRLPLHISVQWESNVWLISWPRIAFAFEPVFMLIHRYLSRVILA